MTNISDLEFVVFDLETTGLEPKSGDKIIEIAAIKLKGLKEVGRFESLLNPCRSLPPGAMEVNGITPQMVAEAPTADKVLPAFQEFVGYGCLVAHNAKFDTDFLAHELFLLNRKLRPEVCVLDTLKVAKAFIPGIGRYALWAVAQAFGLPVGKLHRAMADVELTMEVFKRLISLAERNNIADAERFLAEFGVEKPNYALANQQEMLFNF